MPGLLAAGVLAAAALTAVPMVMGGAKPVLPAGVVGDGGRFGLIDTHQTHEGKPADARADAVRWIRCSKTAWRASHYGECPGPAAYKRVGITVSDRKPGTQSALDDQSSVIGAWVSRTQIPSLAIHSVLMPTGKVLMFAYPNSAKQANTNYAVAFVWDPVNDPTGAAIKEVDPPVNPATGQPYNLWCAGQTLLPNGDVLVAGGTLRYDAPTSPYTPFEGLNAVLTFNPFTESWTVQPSMAHGRWYPTLVRLPNGGVLIMGGYDETGSFVTDPQTGAQTQKRNTDADVFTPSPVNGGVGTITHYPNGDQFSGLYPHLFLVPGGEQNAGEVIMAGPAAGDSKKLEVATLTSPNPISAWNNSDRQPKSLDRQRTWASAVLEPYGPNGPQKIMMIGGSASDTNGDATPTTATLDLAQKGQVGWSWQQSTPAQSQHCWPVPDPDPANTAGCIGRSHGNTVLLPDGSMVSVGGGRGVQALAGANAEDTLFSDPIYAAELWNPATNTWTVGPSQQDARTYHSTALLLPDGSVFSAGDDRPEHQALSGRTAEIYDPPYMFKGARPDIAYPRVTAVGFNQGFQINTTDPSSISAVRIVAPGADTHANDMDQREMSLSFTAGPGGITATSPSDPTIAPPGYYMLFLVNNQGVPSTAAWVRIDAGYAGPAYVDAPPASPTPAPAPAAAATTPAAPVAVKTPPKIASVAKPKSIALKVTRKGGKLVVRFTLPKGTFNGRVGLYQVTPAAKTKVKSGTAKTAPKAKVKLKLVAQHKVAKAKGRITAPLVLPKQVGRTPMRFQVKLALTGTGGLRIVGLRSLTARGR